METPDDIFEPAKSYVKLGLPFLPWGRQPAGTVLRESGGEE